MNRSHFFAIRRGCATFLLLLSCACTAFAAEEVNWKPLFDGKTLDGWKLTNFGGEGDVEVKDGTIVMEFGSPLTGITYAGEFPKMNYEVTLEAMRIDGNDFFAGITFPVADSHCSFILGGWGGAVVGLSSIDDQDASQNDTTQYYKFDSEKWYKIRLRVTPKKIEAWIDGKVWVDQDIEGKKISTRVEVDLSKPFGISGYETRSALQNIKLRELPK